MKLRNNAVDQERIINNQTKIIVQFQEMSNISQNKTEKESELTSNLWKPKNKSWKRKNDLWKPKTDLKNVF